MKTKIIFLGYSLVALGVVGLVGWQFPTSSQRLTVADQKEKTGILESISRPPDVAQLFLENSDTPLRITDAKVKVISGTEFTSLIGKTTDLVQISSLPNVKLLNTSDKTVTGFMLSFRDPIRQKTRSLRFSKLNLMSGKSYVVTPDDVVSLEQKTVTDDKGTRLEAIKSRMESEKYWITVGNQPDYFIMVGAVDFQDGTRWIVKEEGGIQ